MVLGGAQCLWADVQALERLVGGPWPGLVVAVNDAGVDWPRQLHHWVTMHPEKFHRVLPPGDTGAWEARRRANGYPGGYVRWARRDQHLVDRVVECWAGARNSGLLALRAAQAIGCSRAVLCGVPMDRRPHYHGAHGGEPWRWADRHWQGWLAHHHHLVGWVSSMSGRTRQLLGAPTLQWIEQGETHD